MLDPSASGARLGAPSHYDFENYEDLERWGAYWHQIRTVLRLEPKSVLEIGSGTGVFSSYLRRAGLDVETFDLDTHRGSDHVGDVRELDTVLPPGRSYDTICAFQILEHIPYEDFEPCLAKIAARTRRHAVISLPHNGFQVRWNFAIGGMRINVGRSVPYPWPGWHNRQHHWELGTGHPIWHVNRVFKRHFRVVRRGFLPQHPYHYLWVLAPR